MKVCFETKNKVGKPYSDILFFSSFFSLKKEIPQKSIIIVYILNINYNISLLLVSISVLLFPSLLSDKCSVVR